MSKQNDVKGDIMDENRCQAINDNGKRCRYLYDVKERKIHGEYELYNGSAWIVVNLCKKHRKEYGL